MTTRYKQNCCIISYTLQYTDNKLLDVYKRQLFDTIIHKTYNNSDPRANSRAPPPNLPTKKPLQVTDILYHTAEEGAHHAEARTGKNKVSSQVKV